MKKLDELVATKVMGYELHERFGLWYLPGTSATVADGRSVNAWSPSTDLATAWEVVEKMRADEFGFEIRAYINPPTVSFYCPKGPCEKHGNTKHDGHEGECSHLCTPLAICVASLRVIGTPEDTITSALKSDGLGGE